MKFPGLVFFLHGFLGLGSDWEQVIPKDLSSYFYDFFRSGQGLYDLDYVNSNQNISFNELSQSINQKARMREGPRVLVGYSWGGRLALHTLLDSPETWTAAVIISAHPGLQNVEEKKKRIEADRAWARRFQEEPWDSLLKDWNSQAVLQNSGPNWIRKESDFSRRALAQVLEYCSLGKQEDLRDRLKTLSIPILWISGDSDVKFRAFPEEMIRLNPNFRMKLIPQAGHRVPWDQPAMFQAVLTEFLNEVAAKELQPPSRSTGLMK